MRPLVALILLVAAACGAPNPNPAGSPWSQAQLKFAVMDAVGKPQWCDPDVWPLAHDQLPNAIAKYPEIKADAATYAAILAHEHLPSGELSDDQKLAVYKAWKLLTPVKLTAGTDGYSFDYEIWTSTDYFEVTGTVSADGHVAVTSRTKAFRPNCPICLAASTLIATPSGQVRVVDVRVGMIVWTEDASGGRIAEPVVKAGSMEAPAGHRMVHLRLADGRELLASPGHGTADGRTLGSLAVGDPLDGSRVTLWELVPYDGDRTYDLLPGGPTGRYWANGILLASTLGEG
jgi:hypothetical protein